MLVSNPLCEKRQMSAVDVPLAGRTTGIALPPSVHELLAVENTPSAATFKSRSLPATDTPAVVGSTTTMSLPVALGAALLSVITSSEAFGAATTREITFDFVPSGFWIWMETFPAAATSVAVTGAVHSSAEVQFVVRALPAINNTEPGPGLDPVKPLPSTRSVKPCAALAYTLEGCSVRMFVPVEIVTFAAPDS